MFSLRKLMIPSSPHCRPCITAFLMALILMAIPSTRAVAQVPDIPARATKEKPILDFTPFEGDWEIGMGRRHWGIVTTTDLHRVAFVIKRQGKHIAIVDGKECPPANKVYEPEFSADGTRVAYLAEFGDGKRTLVIDGKPGKSCDEFEGWHFGPSGHRIGFVCKQGKQRTVVVDDKEFGPFDDASTPVFSPDSSRYAFGIATPKHEPIAAVIDGKQIGKALPPVDYDVILGVVPGRRYKGESIFGPDGKNTVYLEGQSANWELLIDGVRQPAGHCSALDYSVTFSPNNRHVAFVCIQSDKGKKATVYLDGKSQGDYTDSVGDLTFSPDSKRFYYIAKNGILRPKVTVVVDGKEFTTPRVASMPIFSPDSGHIAWSTAGGVVVDGVAQDITNQSKRDRANERIFWVVFSPDSKRIAYTTADTYLSTASGWVSRALAWDVAVVDNKMQKPYSILGGPDIDVLGSGSYVSPVLFSPDSKHAAYVGREGKPRGICRGIVSCNQGVHSTVVIDGVEGGQYQHIFLAGPKGLTGVWDSPSQLRYLAVKDGVLIEVTDTIGAAN